MQRLASYLLKNRADAEDASQTVFLNVLRALRQGVQPADPRAWLLAITRNVCFSRHRAVAARPEEVELDLDAPSQNGNGRHHEENGTPSADEIVGALARLLPNQRTALILRDFRGVPRAEIVELLSLSPTGVEALLTRARASFREELEADREPFACADTRALVELQLEGVITVAERHSLRAHLRHCSPCSTMARAIRSSRGKLAGLLVWPAELISRLAGAFSQAPSAVHAAAALTTTAVVASVAIPVAIHQTSGSAHVEGRAAPGPALVAPAAASTQRSGTVVVAGLPAVRIPIAVGTAPKPGSGLVAHNAAAARTKPHAHAASPTHAAATGTSPTITTGGSNRTTATPVLVSSVHQTSPAAVAPSASAPQSTGTSPRSTSPATRPSTKPKAKPKPKTRRRSTRHYGGGRHASDPPDRMPSGSAPADGLPPAQNGANDGAGPGFSSGTDVTPAAARTSSSDSAASSTSSGTSGSGSGSTSSASGSSSTSSSSDSSGPAKDKDKDKHKRKH